MSTATSASLGLGRVQAGENDVLYTPRGTPHKRGIVLAHGSGGSAKSWTDQSVAGPFAFAQMLAQAGYVVVAADLGGQVFGNDTHVARIEASRVLLGSYVAQPSKAILVGFSMGGLGALNYCRANPTSVAAIAAVSPSADLDDIRNRNVFGLQSQIDTAWGVTYPAALPTRANPSSQANATAIASSGAPVRIYYSTGDTAVLPATITTLASRIGSTCSTYVISATQDHADALLGLVPAADVLAFLRPFAD